MSELIRPLRAVAKGGSGDINLLAGRAADEIEQLEAKLAFITGDRDRLCGILDFMDTADKIARKV